MKAISIYQRLTRYGVAFVLAVSTLTAVLPFVAAPSASALEGDVVNITNVTELRAAVENQEDGQTWNIQAGTYGLTPFTSYLANGRTGWYLPITANNLTINGVGNPTLYGTGFSANGNWETQNFVSVFGDGVTIQGVTLQPKVEPNKTVEVLGADFTLRNTTIEPNTLVSSSEYDGIANLQDREDLKQWGGSLYFNHAGNHAVENVVIKNAGVSFRYSPAGTNISFSNVVLDYNTSVDWINSYRYSSGFNAAGSTTTGVLGVVYHVSSDLDNLDQVLAAAQAGDVVELESDITVTSQVTIDKAITLNGNGYTITGDFDKTGTDNNSVVAVWADGVSINDLTVQAHAASAVDATGLHGINTYNVAGLQINNVTVLDGLTGINVNGSEVVATNITSAGNQWHAINVDNGGELTISGVNTWDETLFIYIDDENEGTVNDVDDQYRKVIIPNYNDAAITAVVYTAKDATVEAVLPVTDGVTDPLLSDAEFTSLDASVVIPAGTVISDADGTWDGTFVAPIISTMDGVTVPTENGYVTTISLVIEVGAAGSHLELDQAARLVLPGQAGKLAGYIQDGVFTAITTVCSADTQVAGNALPAGGDCYMTVGSDLVIWTKHFTKFVAYSVEQTPATDNNTSDSEGETTSTNTVAVITSGTEAETSTTDQDASVTPEDAEVTSGESDVEAATTDNSGLAWYWWALIVVVVIAAGLGLRRYWLSRNPQE